MVEQERLIKRWNNDLEKIDISEQSRLLNQDKLKDFGRDGMTYKPETSF